MRCMALGLIIVPCVPCIGQVACTKQKKEELRCGNDIPDLFWIKPKYDIWISIGFNNFPFYWRGDV